VLPERIVLPPGAPAVLPVAYANEHVPAEGLWYLGERVPVALHTETHTVFSVPFTAPSRTGEFTRVLRVISDGDGAPRRLIRFRYGVRPPAESASAEGLVLINPAFARPPNWSRLDAPPELCWTEPAIAGPPPLSFRVLVVGPARADSGWITTPCWQTPALPPGDYAWKVFVRDGLGYMNRTNQRPWVFEILH